MVLTLAGCQTWLNEEHCLFEGGDRGCAARQSCVVVIGGGEVAGANDGCLDSDDAAELDPDRLLHLRYGLPMSLEAENDVQRSDSVQGILAREIAARGLEAVCSAVEGAASLDGRAIFDIVFGARERLEALRHERKARDEDAGVRSNEAIAVRELYASIDAWMLACEELAEDGAGSESDEANDTTMTVGSTTGEPPCATNEECAEPAAPFCDAAVGECVSCDALPNPDGACATLDPTTPLCSGGACVACTAEDSSACEEQSLICDVPTGSCVPCTGHVQCGTPDYSGADVP